MGLAYCPQIAMEINAFILQVSMQNSCKLMGGSYDHEFALRAKFYCVGTLADLWIDRFQSNGGVSIREQRR